MRGSVPTWETAEQSCGVKSGVELAESGVRRGAKLAEPGVRLGMRCGGARRRSKSRYSAENQGKP